jgi:hypothetical protein
LSNNSTKLIKKNTCKRKLVPKAMCGHDDDVLSLANGSLPHKGRKSPEEEEEDMRNLQKRNKVFKIFFGF